MKQKKPSYRLSSYGEALVNALPDREAVAKVKRDFARYLAAKAAKAAKKRRKLDKEGRA